LGHSVQWTRALTTSLASNRNHHFESLDPRVLTTVNRSIGSILVASVFVVSLSSASALRGHPPVFGLTLFILSDKARL